MRDALIRFRRCAREVCRFFLGGYARLRFERGTDFRPHVIVPISGGLGNQIWQYCIGMGAHFFSGIPVKYDLHWYEKFGLDISGKERRDFELLQVFPSLSLPTAGPDEAAFFKRYFSYEPYFPALFDESVYRSPRPRYIRGFCGHADYMRLLPADMWKCFRFSAEVVSGNAAAVRRIRENDASVAVHVRCGDYLGSMHEVVTPGYYRRAMDVLKRLLAPLKPCFYIFSNDMGWFRKNLADIREEMVFMDGRVERSVVDDFYLMTQCRHHVIANSTLSWMGAWLCKNPAKRVIMPEAWFNGRAPGYIRRGSETAFRVDGWINLAVD